MTPNSRRTARNTPRSGTHEVRFLDSESNEIQSVKWTPDFRADDSEEGRKARPFTWFVPPDTRVKKVELRIQNRLVDELQVASTNPSMNDLEIDGGEAARSHALVNADHTATLRWNAGDNMAAREASDAPDLVYQVYFSRDNGRTWILVRSGLDNPIAEIDLEKLPGGEQALFKVSTSDGYNVSTLTTQPFEVMDKAPTSSIVAPHTGLVRTQGGGVLLVGRGVDLEDGALSGNALTWVSNLQGEVGNGEKLVVRNLTLGQHAITLRARDGTGKESESNPVTVTIRSR